MKKRGRGNRTSDFQIEPCHTNLMNAFKNKKKDILAFDFSKKTINTYLKLEICVVCRDFVLETNQMIFFFTSETLKTRVETGFSVHNIHLYFFEQVENAKWIL